MFLTKKTQTLFLTKKSQFNPTDISIDLILSPEFYWIRQFQIPVKNVKDAQNVLPTLFEDILPKEEIFFYHAMALEENNYLCFAYNNDTILNAIKTSGLSLSKINRVVFAQTECESLKEFVCDESAFMYTEENILVKIPPAFSQTNQTLNHFLTYHKCSGYKIKLQFYSMSINKKVLYGFMVCLSLILIGNVIQSGIYYKQNQQLNHKKTDIKKRHAMPMSQIETNAILSKMRAQQSRINKTQLALHHILNYNQKGISATLIHINMKNQKEIEILFEKVDRAKMELYLKEHFKDIEQISKNDTILFKVRV